MKIHCNNLHQSAQFANDRAVCGQTTGWTNIGRDVYRDRLVRRNVFRWVPDQARCGRCSDGDRSMLTLVTDEHVIAVECFLIGISRLYAPELTKRGAV